MFKLLGKIKDYLIIKQSRLFDEEYYCLNYQDMRQADINPLWHFVSLGWKENRNPNNSFCTAFYLAENPDVKASNVNPLVHFIKFGNREGRRIDPLTSNIETTQLVMQNPYHNNPSLRPLNTYHYPYSQKRINLITDSINDGSLFGGVATGMILATLLANKTGATLRIVTRTEEADKDNYLTVLRANKIHEPEKVEFVFVNQFSPISELPVGDQEFYLTTSWWTTYSTLQTVDPKDILYLLQEDERMFYPYGDDHLLCSSVLANAKIKFVINSQLLYDYFVADGLENLKENAYWFEPAFSKEVFYYQQQRSDRKQLFFYARPNNLRNLYLLGTQVINLAIENEILDTSVWDINFVGKDLHNISLSQGVKPVIRQNLDWFEYGKLVRSMDLGLSLMYTPHPSYPPLDLAAAGCIVVTNKWKNKQDLSQYSRNILMADLSEASLLGVLREGFELALDDETRLKNYNLNQFIHDWHESFAEVLKKDWF